MVSYNLINKIRLFLVQFPIYKNYNYLNKSIFDNFKGFLIAFSSSIIFCKYLIMKNGMKKKLSALLIMNMIGKKS